MWSQKRQPNVRSDARFPDVGRAGFFSPFHTIPRHYVPPKFKQEVQRAKINSFKMQQKLEDDIMNKLDFETLVRGVIADVGFDNPDYNFDNNSCEIFNNLHSQSEDIREMVDCGGAGDQGLMFGYAVDEIPELMPLPILMAHRLVERMDFVRKEKLIDYLKPDGKSQVTIRYMEGRPAAVEKVVLAVPYEKDIEKSSVKHDLFEAVVSPVIEKYGCKYSAQFEGMEENFIVKGNHQTAESYPADL